MIHLVDRKYMAAFFNKFYGKMWDGFCLNTEKRFRVERFILRPIKWPYVLLKTLLGVFRIALRLKDRLEE